MPMPRNGFDSLAAVARLNTDSTSHHRERWPTLDWVWNELDELRANAETCVAGEDFVTLEGELNATEDLLEALADQRDALSKAVMLLLRDDPDMDQVQRILAGAAQ